MTNYVYENHSMTDHLLPFIYHKRFVVTRRNSLPNWHENVEILQCIAGRGYVQCGAEHFDFEKGDLFVVNPNTPHCICSEGSVAYRCLIVGNSFCADNGIAMEQLHFMPLIRDEALYSQFDAVAEVCADRNRPWATAEIRWAVLGFLLGLCRNYLTDKPATGDSPASEHVKNALVYIRQNIGKPLSLDDISDHTGISKYHLSREFKAFTGKTIVQTVNLIRCAEARRMIEEGESVSAAAVNCGFDNLSYFTRTFKKHFGVLPSTFLPGEKPGGTIAYSAMEEADCY